VIHIEGTATRSPLRPRHHPRPHRGRHVHGRRGRDRRRRAARGGARSTTSSRRPQAARGGRRDHARGPASGSARPGPCGVDVTTAPHPGFPTDMQAQIMVLMCLAGARASSARRSSRTASCTCPSSSAWAPDIEVRRQRRGRPPACRSALRRERDGDGPARERVARDRGPRRLRRDRGAPRVPPRSRLRAHGGEAQRARRRQHPIARRRCTSRAARWERAHSRCRRMLGRARPGGHRERSARWPCSRDQGWRGHGRGSIRSSNTLRS
jgi:hypothetical protein